MKIGIIGAGIAGLSAAYYISKHGHNITIFEKDSQIGGLAGSIKIGSHLIEKHHHFICGGDSSLINILNELNLSKYLEWKYSGMGYYYNGKLYNFSKPLDLLFFNPVSLIGKIKFGLHIMASKRKSEWEHLDKITAEQWLIKNIGESAYRAIWYPLLKFKFHNYYDILSAAWIWHRIWRVANSRESLLKPDKYGYLKFGTQTLIDALQNKLADNKVNTFINTKILKINIAPDNKIKLLTNNKEYIFDSVISTVPVSILSKLLPDSEINLKSKADSVKYLSVISALFLLKRKLTNSFWINISDPNINFNGIIEYSNLNPRSDLDFNNILYIPNYLPHNSRLFNYTENELKNYYFSGLKTFDSSLTENDIVDTIITKSHYAQPVCETYFLSKMINMQTSIPNFYVIDATHLYPSDRTLSGLIGLSKKLSEYFV